MGLTSKLNTAARLWRKGGISALHRRILWKMRLSSEHRSYQRWVADENRSRSDTEKEIVAQIDGFDRHPLISIVLPVYNTEEQWLRKCIESVLGQSYRHWELCISDDKSESPHVRGVLQEYAGIDDRVKLFFRPENGHISACSNSALEMATGEFTVLLDHDDELSPDALFHVAREILLYPDTALIYSDEDMIDTKGRRFLPNFKPDFSYDLLLSVNLITHLSAFRTDLLRSIGGFRTGLEGSQDYDLALRVIERISKDQIRHIPKILYHWRAIPGSVALSSEEKPYAHERARVAIREHLERKGVHAEVSATEFNFHRVSYALSNPAPLVSIIVDASSAEGLRIRELISTTDYPSFEVVVVLKEGEPPDCESKVVIEQCSDPRLAHRLNRGIRRSTGDICVLVREGTIPCDSDWLSELVRFAARDEIGAVGGRILGPDRTVLDGALIIGTTQGAEPAHFGFPIEYPGMTARNVVAGGFSAVSESCIALKRKDFEAAGGFDEANLPNSLFAADLCLRLGEQGLRIVSTPFAQLVDRQKLFGKPPSEPELRYFRSKWIRQNRSDPMYNPNLSKHDGTFAIDA